MYTYVHNHASRQYIWHITVCYQPNCLRITSNFPMLMLSSVCVCVCESCELDRCILKPTALSLPHPTGPYLISIYTNTGTHIQYIYRVDTVSSI